MEAKRGDGGGLPEEETGKETEKEASLKPQMNTDKHGYLEAETCPVVILSEAKNLCSPQTHRA